MLLKVIEEDAISLVCLHLASTDEWTTHQCSTHIALSVVSCSDDRWFFEDKRALLWNALHQPGLSLTAVEGSLIYDDLERRSQEQGWLDRSDISRSIIRARQVSIMWGVVDDEVKYALQLQNYSPL